MSGRRVAVALGVVAAVAVAAVAGYAWLTPTVEPGWRSQILEAAYAPVHSDPEFLERTRGLSAAEVDKLVGETRQRGMMRLEDPTLIRRAAIYGGALDAASEPICAILARGASPDGGTNVGVLLVNELAPAALREWADISALAILAELHRLPAPRLTRVEANGALDFALSIQSEADRDRLAGALADPFGVSDSEICWAGRTLYEALARLPPGPRGMLARVLAAG